MMRSVVKLLVMLPVAILAGCATAPKIDCEKAKMVQVGMSQPEVSSLLGEPYMVGMGRDFLVWGWQNNEDRLQSTQTLVVDFSRDTKVVKKISGTCAR